MVELAKCRYCKCRAAETYKVGDLWYVRCKGTKKCTRKNKDGVVETFYKKCDSWGPYEFLGLKELPQYSESELEQRLIDHLQTFLLELGKGFAFVGRQVRFTFDEQHFRVDLVFYNRLLRAFVLIDLKRGTLKHQDLGQMQMYVNYYDRFVKTEDENPTIGILLCTDKSDAMVEITLPKDNNQIFASKYQTYLPSKEELKRLIEENIK